MTAHTDRMLRHIEQTTDALKTLGYAVTAEPIPGMEEDFYLSLTNAYWALHNALKQGNKRYGYRGRSKAALAVLHADYPRPCFGVEVA